MAKLSKADIQKTLDSTPIETILSGKAKGIKLTTKQKRFAKGVAEGMTKSEAYRQAYNTSATPKNVSADASKLASNPVISTVIEAYKQAFEAREYHKPAQIRELLINQLVQHSLNEDFPPAQRVKSLELLGKLSDVGAFTERKESVVIHESGKLKERLLDQLKTIVGGDIQEVSDEGDKLLADLDRARSGKNSQAETHPHPTPQDIDSVEGELRHNNPHKQSSLNSDNSDLSETCKNTENNNEENQELTEGVSTLTFEEGVGVDKNSEKAVDVEYREVPPSEKGTPEKREG